MALGKIYQIIPIVFGIILIMCQKNNSEEYLPDLYHPKVKYFGIPGIDNMFNFQVSFFRQYLSEPSNILLSHTLFPLAMINLFIVAIEGSIPGASGFNELTSYYVLVAAMSAFIGISIAIPLIWIPAWIASENRRENFPRPRDVTLNPKRVKQIGLGILSMLPFLVGLTIFKQDNLVDWSVIFLLISFPLSALFWIWYPKNVNPSSVDQNGYDLASKFSLILFGISIYEWLLVLEHAVDNNFEILIGTITELISGITYPATDYMIIDTWSLIAALTYWVFLAEKAKFNRKVWKFIGQSILCGPGGALSLYAYHRYQGMIGNDYLTNATNASSRLRYMGDNERQPLLSS